MGEVTGISWCDHTFNAWRGCTRASPGCANCYAETLSARNPGVLGSWGPRGPRVPAAEGYWGQLRRWNRKAEQAGVRRRVFVNSLADIFEGDDTMPAASRPIVAACRERLWREIHLCRSLDFLLLTKRPENAQQLTPASWWENGWPSNVWFGASAENQEWYDRRVLHLRTVPAAVRFWSLEPLLGPIDLFSDAALGAAANGAEPRLPGDRWIDWVIVGGESGPRARPCDLEWIRAIVRLCRESLVPCFTKQLGSRPRDIEACLAYATGDERACEQLGCDGDSCKGEWLRLKHPKGGDPAEWPEDLRVQQWPEARA